MKIWRGIGSGLAAGAAGTTALNAVTYLDMAIRGRPASKTPEESVEKIADEVGATIPGDQHSRSNRLAGLGPLTGIATGVGIGVALGVARALGFRPNLLIGALISGAGAMAATDISMAELKVTDPTTWNAKSWLSDAIPHAAYGFVTFVVLRGLDHRQD
jgi:hypothetical protein